MLSLGQFVRVIEMLYHMRHFDRAALFIEACQEFDLLENTEETCILCSVYNHACLISSYFIYYGNGK